MRLGPLVRRARRDDAGSIIPVTAVALAALFGFAGLGIDLGVVFLEKRRVQSLADLAALASVRSNNSVDAARRALSDNGYGTRAELSVTPGTYSANRATPAAGRFAGGGSDPNAAHIRLTSSVRTGFSRVIGAPASYAVSGEATAMRADLAAFGLGSRLVGLDAGIANALLSRLLGTTITLSIMDYRALASLRIDALGFLRAAAPRVGIQAGTYDEVLKASLSALDLTTFLAQAAERTSTSAPGLAALNALTAVLSGTGLSVRLAGLLTAGAYGPLPLTRTGEALWVNALDVFGAAAFLANGSNQVGLDLGSAVPGLLRARITLRIGEAWRTSGFVGSGAGLSTAQQRLLVEVWIPGPAGLISLYLPVYLELAPARATLRKVACPWTTPGERAVTLDVTTGVSYLAIGTTSASAIDLGAPRPGLVPAPILQVPLLTVSGTASLELGASTQSVSFGDDDIRAGRTKTVSTGNLAGSLSAGLLANLDLRINGTGLPGILDPRGLVSTALAAAAQPIDALLFSVLNLAGVKVGSADVSVTGTRCGGAVLVQ